MREPEEEDLMMQLSPLFLEKIQATKTKEGQAVTLRQLNRRVGNVSIKLETQIKDLPLERLKELGEALLDFSQMSDLLTWLDTE